MSSVNPQSPPFFFAPFVSSVQRVESGWIDHNGHLNMAYYHVLFDRALDETFGWLGIGVDYLRERNLSTFTAECHVVYKRELSLGDPIRVTVQLIDFDEKRLHYYLELRHAEEGWLSATSENMSLNIDMTSRKVAPFPADILDNLRVMRAAHRQLPRPAALGRVMEVPRPAETREHVLN